MNISSRLSEGSSARFRIKTSIGEFDEPPPPPEIKFLGPGNNLSEFLVSVSNTAYNTTLEKRVGEGQWVPCPETASLALSAYQTTYFRTRRKATVSAWTSNPYSDTVSKGIIPFCLVSPSTGPVHTILLVGCTGAGKSRWGNYLGSHGQIETFKVGHRSISCSQVRSFLRIFSLNNLGYSKPHGRGAEPYSFTSNR